MVPFYNIWGIWDTLMTIAGRFKTEEGLVQEMGNALKSWVLRFYELTLLSNILNRVIFQSALTETYWERPILVLISGIVDLWLAYVLLEIAKTVLTAINHKANLSNSV
jgi:hypothetical protein